MEGVEIHQPVASRHHFFPSVEDSVASIRGVLRQMGGSWLDANSQLFPAACVGGVQCVFAWQMGRQETLCGSCICRIVPGAWKYPLRYLKNSKRNIKKKHGVLLRMKIFAFVILHYNTIDDTRECVSSIRNNIEDGAYHIIIVDNGSPNGSGQILANDYQYDKNITVIINNENLGFARGNNVGFKYAKEKLSADFIILANSDTALIDDQFVSLILEEYERSHFAVLGPEEIIPDPPFVYRQEQRSLITRQDCLTSIFKVSWNLILNYLGLDLLNFHHNSDNKYTGNVKNEMEEDVMLHGFFLVFSPVYIEKFDGLNPRTFLYREEDLLLHRLFNNGMKSVYLPSLKVFHKKSVTVNSLSQNSREIRRFKYKQLIKSTWILYQELGKNE